MSDKLKNWAIDFLKSRDAVKKDIIGIENTKDGFLIKSKSEDVLCLVLTDLSASLELLENKKINIFTFNSNDNFNFLTQNWNELSKFEKLKIFFVNPKSGTETKWVISPYMHNLISDEDSLEKGLKAMFNTVETV